MREVYTFSSRIARANTCRVRAELLRVRERDDCRRVVRKSLRFVSHHAAALEKFVDADAAGEARRRVRRQAVARARDVIAGGDGREWAEKNSPGVAKLFQHIRFVFDLDCDVLGGEAIG